jgi:hypothetical protein
MFHYILKSMDFSAYVFLYVPPLVQYVSFTCLTFLYIRLCIFRNVGNLFGKYQMLY